MKAATKAVASPAAAVRTKKVAPTVSFKPPSDWLHQYSLIKAMRAAKDAPVDLFGPKALAQVVAHDRELFSYHVLTALQLSSQTRDQKTAEAMRALQSFGLTVPRIAAAEEEALVELVRPVGFYKKKAKYLIQTAQILLERHGGVVPNDLAALLDLPGVGPKMAHLTLTDAFDVHVGIGVDTHVHRMANQLGWAKSETAEKTRLQLESWLPREEWGVVNEHLVGLGQMMSQPAFREGLAATVAAFPETERLEAKRLLKRLGLDVSRSKEFLSEEAGKASSSPSKKRSTREELDQAEKRVKSED